MTRFGLAAFAALSLLAVPAQAQQAVGVASAVQNDVRIRKPGAPLPRAVALRQRIALADQVQTGAKSQLQVLLLDKSIFTVGPNARLTIDRYVYDPNRGTRSMGATVTRGAFRFMSGRRTTGGSSTINTPVAAIGVRGTIVEGVVGEDAALIVANERGIPLNLRADPETASLIVLRGPGGRTQGNVSPGAIDVVAGGRTVTADRPMLAIYVPYAGAPPVGPFTLSNAGLMQLQAVLFPALAQRLGLRPPVDPNRRFAPATDWTRPGDEDPRPPFPNRPPPGAFDSGPPPGVNPPQLPFGNLPQPQRPQGPGPQQPGPQQQDPGPGAKAPGQGPAAAPAGQPGANNPPKDSLPPPNLKVAPNPQAAAPPPAQDDPGKQAPAGQPNQKPNDPGKGKKGPPPPPPK
ncbi:MAG: FecR family protein [Pseudomonadota bacterium]